MNTEKRVDGKRWRGRMVVCRKVGLLVEPSFMFHGARSNLGWCVCVGAGAFALAVSYHGAIRNPRVSKTAVSNTRAVFTTRK